MHENLAPEPEFVNLPPDVRRFAQRWGLMAHRGFMEDIERLWGYAFEEGKRSALLTSGKGGGREGGEGRRKEGSVGQDGVRKEVPSFLPPSLPPSQERREGSKKELIERDLEGVGLRSRGHIAIAALNLSRFDDPAAALGAVVEHAQRHANGYPIAGLVATICGSPDQLKTIVGDAMERKGAASLKSSFESFLQQFRKAP